MRVLEGPAMMTVARVPAATYRLRFNSQITFEKAAGLMKGIRLHVPGDNRESQIATRGARMLRKTIGNRKLKALALI
ncbi:MAG TPA: hypothetical protein VI479_17585 [Blastocatellia bacterium]